MAPETAVQVAAAELGLSTHRVNVVYDQLGIWRRRGIKVTLTGNDLHVHIPAHIDAVTEDGVLTYLRDHKATIVAVERNMASDLSDRRPPAWKPDPRARGYGLLASSDEALTYLLGQYAKMQRPVPCPACGKASWYHAFTDQLTHEDGSANDRCYLRILRHELRCRACGNDSWDDRVQLENDGPPSYWLDCTRCGEPFVDIETARFDGEGAAA